MNRKQMALLLGLSLALGQTAFAADLSHYRTCGSASGGSVNLTSRFTKIFLC